jgi:hypothetical protein
MSAEDGAYVEDWNELKVQELREELQARNLDTSGNKQALVARLEAADAAAEVEEDDAAEAEGPEMAEDESEPYEPPNAPHVEPEAASEPESGEETVPGPSMYYAEFDVPDDYEPDDEEWDLSWKLAARDEALAAGHEVYPAAYSASMYSHVGNRIVYQVPVKS